MIFFYLFGLLVGFSLPVQTSANTRLVRRTGSPFNSSLVSFLVSLAVLVLALLVTGEGLDVPFARIAAEPFWIWIGGLCGVLFLTGNVVLMPRLGAVETVVLPVTGQVLMGLLVDHFGWFRSTVHPITVLRAIGAVLVVVGVILVAVTGANAAEKQNRGRLIWIWRLLGIGAGMLSAAQTAVNGYLGSILHSALQASLVSFLVGIAFLAIICAVLRIRNGKPEVEKGGRPWWMWIGGILGALYVFTAAFLSARIGTGLSVVILLSGSIQGSFFIDQFGWFHAAKKPFRWQRVLGLLVLFGGVLLIRLT